MWWCFPIKHAIQLILDTAIDLVRSSAKLHNVKVVRISRKSLFVLRYSKDGRVCSNRQVEVLRCTAPLCFPSTGGCLDFISWCGCIFRVKYKTQSTRLISLIETDNLNPRFLNNIDESLDLPLQIFGPRGNRVQEILPWVLCRHHSSDTVRGEASMGNGKENDPMDGRNDKSVLFPLIACIQVDTLEQNTSAFL